MKKHLLGFIVSLIVVFWPTTLTAAYDQYVQIIVTNNNTASYSYLPVLITLNNSQLASYGYILNTGLDTNFAEGTASHNYSLTQNRAILIIPSLTGGQTRNYQYQLGYSPAQTDYPLAVGYGGYINVSDAAGLELGNDFEVETSGYVNTAAGSNKNILTKGTDFTLAVSGANTVTATIAGDQTHLQALSGGLDSGILQGGIWATLPATIGADTSLITTNTTLKNLNISVDIQPGAGKTRTYTIYKNNIATSLAVTISESETSGSDNGNTVDVNTGDIIDIRYTSTGAPGGTAMRWAMYSKSDNPNERIMGAGVNLGTATTPIYFTPASSGGAATESQMSSIVPCDGEISNLGGYLRFAPGTSKSNTLTLYKNGAPTSLTVTLSNAETYDIDAVNSVSVSAGDLISVESVKVNSPTTGGGSFGFVFTATTDGEQFIPQGVLATSNSTPTSTGYSNVFPSENGVISWNTYDSNKQQVNALTIQSMNVSVSAAPGGGNSWIYTLMKNGVATTQTITIADAATSGVDAAHPITFAEGDTIALRGEVVGTPSVASQRVSFLASVIADEVSVSATVSSGEHVLKVTADSTDLKIYVDTNLEDTIALNGAIVENNALDYLIDQNNVMPYINYFKMTIGAALELWYQPVTLVNPLAVADRSGNGNTGVITYGANPAGIEITIGGITGGDYTSPGGGTGDDPAEVMSPGGGGFENTSDTGSDLPYYDIFDRAADSMGTSTQALYGLMAIFVAILVLVAVAIATGSTMMGLIGAGITAGVGAAMILGPWVVLIMALGGAMLLYVYRRT